MELGLLEEVLRTIVRQEMAEVRDEIKQTLISKRESLLQEERFYYKQVAEILDVTRHTVGNYSKRLHLHTNETHKEYRIPQHAATIKFLEWDEIKLLMTIQPETDIEEQSRDILLFACFTGMRYSDIRNLKKSDIKEHRFENVEGVFHAAHIRQVKTSRETVVPLLPEALAIIKRHDGWNRESVFPQLANQTVNDALRIVGEKAGLNTLQKVEVFRGAKRETKYLEKWRLLTTHIGRRTFVTISATKGIPINVVASITGQNPATTMRHYMGVVNAEKFKEITSKFQFD